MFYLHLYVVWMAMKDLVSWWDWLRYFMQISQFRFTYWKMMYLLLLQFHCLNWSWLKWVDCHMYSLLSISFHYLLCLYLLSGHIQVEKQNAMECNGCLLREFSSFSLHLYPVFINIHSYRHFWSLSLYFFHQVFIIV